MSEFVNPLRTIWKDGRCAVNGWIAVPSVISAEAMSKAGWDSVTVDMQHGTADYRDLLSILPVIERWGSVPLVRVPWPEPAWVMRALDAGALGIIAPMIEGPEDAAIFVSMCRYPPEGARSFGPIRARLVHGDRYFATANREVLPIAMIETRSALEQLKDILAVPGLGAIYIGPADLSLSLGFPPGFDREEPEMLEVIGHIVEACREAGVPACIHCGSPAYARRMAEKGFMLTTISSDARFVEQGAVTAVRTFRGLD